MRKGHLSRVISKGSGENKRSLARAFTGRRHESETLRKLQTKNMSVAQIGDCTCAFEEPQLENHSPFFHVQTHLFYSP